MMGTVDKVLMARAILVVFFALQECGKDLLRLPQLVEEACGEDQELFTMSAAVLMSVVQDARGE